GGPCAPVSGATFSSSGAGDCVVKAYSAATTNYLTSSAQQTVTIAKANQTITFAALASKTYGNPDFTVTANASSGLAVAFAATGYCTVSINTVHITGAGPCTITASQAGSTTYNAAPNVLHAFTINKAILTVTANPAASQYSDPIALLSATIAGFVNNDTPSVVTGSAALTTTAT